MGDESRNLTTRCLAETAGRMTAQLPASWRQRVSVQLLPMSYIISPRCGVAGREDGGDAGLLSHIKSMALAVYTSIDRVISPSLINANRTLTGMGPAADKEVISATFQVGLLKSTHLSGIEVNRGHFVGILSNRFQYQSKLLIHDCLPVMIGSELFPLPFCKSFMFIQNNFTEFTAFISISHMNMLRNVNCRQLVNY